MLERRREPGHGSRIPGAPKVAAWAVIAVLVATVFIGLSSLGGVARAVDKGARIVNPTHDAVCSDSPRAVLNRCQAPRPSEPEEPSASPSDP